MAAPAKTEEKQRKKSKALERVVDIDSSFDVLEELLNDLLKMLGLTTINKAEYQKLARAKLETRTYKSQDDKKFWELRQNFFFRGAATQSAINSIKKEFSQKEDKLKKVAETAPLLESITKNLRTLQKHSKNAASNKDRELNRTQEILDEKERMLQAQLATGVKAGLKDDETAKKMKELGGIRNEAIESNRLSIEAAEALIDTLEELEGAAGLVALAMSYYRRYSSIAQTGGGIIGGIMLLIIIALVYKKVLPMFSRPVATKQTQLKSSGPMETRPGAKGEKSDIRPGIHKQKELTPDEKFKMVLLKKDRFIPNCSNNFVVLVGNNLTDSIAEKEAKHFLKSINYKIEGAGAVEIIKLRDEAELIAALRNGAINSPYCIKNKLFLPKKINYDFARFPVYLPEGVEPQTQDALFIIKEQLSFAKKKLRRLHTFLLPKLYFAEKKEKENGGDKKEAYRMAVKEYLDQYKKALLAAEGKNSEPS